MTNEVSCNFAIQKLSFPLVNTTCSQYYSVFGVNFGFTLPTLSFLNIDIVVKNTSDNTAKQITVKDWVHKDFDVNRN